MTSRVLSLLLAFVAWFCSGWALLLGVVYGLGLKCDESCHSQEGWRGDPDAWQWYGIAGLGLLAFVCGAAFVFFVWRRRPWSATVVMVIGLTSAALLTGAFSTTWIEHLDRRSPAELLLITASGFAPVLAVLLSVPDRRKTRF